MRISDWSSDVCSSDLLTLGSTFLDRVTVDTLKAQLDDVQAQVDLTNEENATLGHEVDELSTRDDALAEVLPERLLDGRLDGLPVLALATRGTPAAPLEQALGEIGRAERRERVGSIGERAGGTESET